MGVAVGGCGVEPAMQACVVQAALHTVCAVMWHVVARDFDGFAFGTWSWQNAVPPQHGYSLRVWGACCCACNFSSTDVSAVVKRWGCAGTALSWRCNACETAVFWCLVVNVLCEASQQQNWGVHVCCGLEAGLAVRVLTALSTLTAQVALLLLSY